MIRKEDWKRKVYFFLSIQHLYFKMEQVEKPYLTSLFE